MFHRLDGGNIVAVLNLTLHLVVPYSTGLNLSLSALGLADHHLLAINAECTDEVLVVKLISTGDKDIIILLIVNQLHVLNLRVVVRVESGRNVKPEVDLKICSEVGEFA